MPAYNSDWVTKSECHITSNGSYSLEARPLIICLCGGYAVPELEAQLYVQETVENKIVVQLDDEGLETDKDSELIRNLNRHKIDLSDEMLVINNGVLMPQTIEQIKYAKKMRKTIYWLYEEDDEIPMYLS